MEITQNNFEFPGKVKVILWQCMILECPLKAKKRTLNILAYFRGLLCSRHRASSTGPFMWKKVRTEQSVLSVNMKDEVYVYYLDR